MLWTINERVVEAPDGASVKAYLQSLGHNVSLTGKGYECKGMIASPLVVEVIPQVCCVIERFPIERPEVITKGGLDEAIEWVGDKYHAFLLREKTKGSEYTFGTDDGDFTIDIKGPYPII